MENGIMLDNLEEAVLETLKLDRNKVHKSSLQWSWETCYQQFIDILVNKKI